MSEFEPAPVEEALRAQDALVRTHTSQLMDQFGAREVGGARALYFRYDDDDYDFNWSVENGPIQKEILIEEIHRRTVFRPDIRITVNYAHTNRLPDGEEEILFVPGTTAVIDGRTGRRKMRSGVYVPDTVGEPDQESCLGVPESQFDKPKSYTGAPYIVSSMSRGPSLIVSSDIEAYTDRRRDKRWMKSMVDRFADFSEVEIVDFMSRELAEAMELSPTQVSGYRGRYDESTER